jgi:hypothetical protein
MADHPEQERINKLPVWAQDNIEKDRAGTRGQGLKERADEQTKSAVSFPNW